jgi:hypothetical protein
MQATSIAFFPVFIVGAILLAGLVGVVLLIANAKTRPIGLVLLVLCPVVLAGLAVLGFFFVAVERVETTHNGPYGQAVPVPPGQRPAIDLDTEAVPSTRPMQAQGVTLPAEKTLQPAPIAPPAVSGPSASPGKENEKKTLLKALGNAVRNAVLHDSKPEAGKAGSAGSGTPAKPADARKPAAKPLPVKVEAESDARPAQPAVGTAKPPVVQVKPAGARPAWVDQPPRVANGGYEMVVTVGPWRNRSECDASMGEELETAVRRFTASHLGVDEREAARVHLQREWIRSKIVKEEYFETIHSEAIASAYGSEKPLQMVQLHALLRFDREARDEIDRKWSAIVAERRLWGAGGGLAGVLVLLSLAWGYLRADIATGGAYRWRLRLLFGGLVGALIAAGLALMA